MGLVESGGALGAAGADGESDALRDIDHKLSVIESRCSVLLRQHCRAELPPPAEDVEQLPLLLADVRQCAARLGALAEPTEMTFERARRVRTAEERCVWLYRRLRTVELRRGVFRLEARLLALVSADARGIFREMRRVGEWERAFRAAGGAQIRRWLLSSDPVPGPGTGRRDHAHEISNGQLSGTT